MTHPKTPKLIPKTKTYETANPILKKDYAI